MNTWREADAAAREFLPQMDQLTHDLLAERGIAVSYVLIPEEAAPQFLDDAAPRNGMMPPPDSEMIAPPITE